jgi:methyltransferase family protein
MTGTISSNATHSGAQHFCRTVRSVQGLGAKPRVFVGCGKGQETLFIRKELGGSLVGVDISENWIRSWAPTSGTSGCWPGSILDSQYAGDSFDVVFYHHVVETSATSRQFVRTGLDPAPGRADLWRNAEQTPRGWLSQFIRRNNDAETAVESQRIQGAAYPPIPQRNRCPRGFSEKELHSLLEARFTDIRFLTADYLRSRCAVCAR